MPLSRRGRDRRLRAAALVAGLLCAPVLAQQAPPNKGTILDSLPDRRPQAPLSPPQVLFPREGERVAQDRNGPRFLVQGFRIEGNTVFTEGRLKRLLERFYDLELNLYDLNKAADAITRYYQDNGYPVARAVIPAQRVEAGVVRIEVIEGTLSRILFRGNQRYGEDFLARMAALLGNGRVATVDELERVMLLLNDLPGLQARSTLQPGAEFGSTEAVIQLEEKAAGITFGLNNFGRKESGVWRADVNAELNNPTGTGDQLGFRGIRSADGLTEFRRFSYSMPVGTEGMRMAIGHSAVDYKVAGTFASLGIRGTVKNTDLVVTYPYLRSRSRNVSFGAGWRNTGGTQKALATPLSQNSLDIATAYVAGNWVHEDSATTSSVLQVSGNGRRNFSGARSQEAMRAKLDLDVNHLAGLSNHWDLAMRLNLVGGASALPDTERFSLGGPDSVRAYLPGELRGDMGYLLSAEFRRTFNVGRMFGTATVFVDQGAVANRGFDGTDQLSGIGAGLSLLVTRDAKLKVDYALPTGRVPGDGAKGGRLWITASITF